jgi:hypothetical protein
MKKLGSTAALVALALLTASCRPPGPQPSENLPPSRPAVEAETPEPGDQPAPAQAERAPVGQTESPPDQPADPQADAADPQKDASQSTGVRVLGAIGKAVRNSVAGGGQK